MERMQLRLDRDWVWMLFVCDWHLQMVSASSEALMAVIHHGACDSSRRCCDKSNPAQVNDQSLQREWRCMSFSVSSPYADRNASGWKTTHHVCSSSVPTCCMFILNDQYFLSICNQTDFPSESLHQRERQLSETDFFWLIASRIPRSLTVLSPSNPNK